MITATRCHDFSYGHRVSGHESKCACLHGHNGRVHFTVAGAGDDELDALGRVIDFGIINTKLCEWLEENWDHRFLVYAQDHLKEALLGIDPSGVVVVPFNPTAENMALHLLHVVGPKQLAGTEVQLIKVVVEETRKCSATVTKPVIMF